MKSRRVEFIVIAVATVISALTVGLAIGAAAWSRQQDFTKGVEACVRAVAMRDPSHGAFMDARLGERRFYFDFVSEFDGTGTAMGVILQRNPSGMTRKSCYRKGQGSWRELPFRNFSRYIPAQLSHPPVDPFDPPKTACGMAVDKYIRQPTHYVATRCGWRRVGLRRGSCHRACRSAWRRRGTA
jgi:hypothetical protein